MALELKSFNIHFEIFAHIISSWWDFVSYGVGI